LRRNKFKEKLCLPKLYFFDAIGGEEIDIPPHESRWRFENAMIEKVQADLCPFLVFTWHKTSRQNAISLLGS